jgi:hypothetical protein
MEVERGEIVSVPARSVPCRKLEINLMNAELQTKGLIGGSLSHHFPSRELMSSLKGK